MRYLFWFPVALIISLAGCSGLEKKPDIAEKVALKDIQSTVEIRQVWATNAGNGVGKRDLNLGLQVYRDHVLTVDHSGELNSYELITGAHASSVSLKDKIVTGPNIYNDKILAINSNAQLLAYSQLTGERLWTKNLAGEVLATLVSDSDITYIHSMDGSITAISLIDGRELWRFSNNVPSLMLRRASSPVILDDQIIAGFSNGKLIALHRNDGRVIWSRDISVASGKTDVQRMIDITSDPVVQNEIVYIGSYQGNFTAINLSSGNTIWERNISTMTGSTLDSKTVYIATTDGDLVALSKTTGDTLWLNKELHGRVLTTPVTSKEYIIVADEDGLVHVLDKKSGIRVAKYFLDNKGIKAKPLVYNNMVYILGRSGKLVALEVG